MIEIKSEILAFDYFNSGIKVGHSKTRANITDENFIDLTFPFRQIIGFENSYSEYLKMDLLGNYENTIVKKLSWRFFSSQALNEIAQKFELSVSIINNNIYLKINDTGLNAAIGLKNVNKRCIASIFTLELPDLYRGAGKLQGELYIHGIWEVEQNLSSS